MFSGIKTKNFPIFDLIILKSNAAINIQKLENIISMFFDVITVYCYNLFEHFKILESLLRKNNRNQF